jgi:hypothetical protein
MPCDPFRISCQLSQLVAAQSGWDWNSFATTLVATLIGGALGVFGVWLGFRWQSKHRYREVLDDCLVKVLEQIAAHATILHAVNRQDDVKADYERAGVDYYERTGESPVYQPADFSMSITLDIAQMRARGEDQSILSDAIRAHDHIRTIRSIPDRLGKLGLLGGALSRWRSGIWSAQRVRDSLARISAMAEPFDTEVPA